MFPLLVLILLPVMSCINSAASQSHASENGFNNETSHCIDKERQALLAFKAGLVVDDDIVSLSSWSSEEGNKDCCNWSGVECSNRTGHVIKLDLQDFRLRGNISSSLLELRELNYLDLSHNDFEHRPIPNFFGSFTKLHHLDLSFTHFGGAIPSQLGNLSVLNSLYVIASDLVGTIPSQLGNLSSLKYLDLSFNLLDGMIPESFGNLCNLQDLHLENNSLSGNLLFVDNLFSCAGGPALKSLSLPGNQLNGTLNKKLGTLSKLEVLDLSGCRLTGTIPSQLGNLSNLVYLYLSYNLLDGMIPRSFGNLCNLQYLRLSNSRLVGTIPSQLGNLSNLVVLDLSTNLLDGMIPDSFGNMCNLTYLRLWNNSLSGNLSFVDNLSRCATTAALEELSLSANQLNETLTKNLGTLSNLQHLDLSSNSLTGIVSEAHFSNFSYLSYLDLSLNHLDFQISHQWVFPFLLDSIKLKSCNLGPSFPQWIRTQKMLSYVDFSNSGISDSIPSWFWDVCSGCTYLNLSSNNIGGILPDLSSTFGSYPSIYLSSNNFEGPIPLFPSYLASLNLSRNKFTGTLSFLCQINGENFSFLDISNNLLTGGLPDCLGKLHELVVLNLAHNKLSGKLPSSVGSLSSLETLYLYNNSFSGVLPKSLANCTWLSFLDVGRNNFTGNVPSWIGGNMSQLYILSLRSNYFFGTIPSNLCRLTRLHVLDLSINNLYGTIPPCLNNISAMVHKGLEVTHHQYPNEFVMVGRFPTIYGALRYVDYSVIVWQGTEREFGNNLKLLKTIDLSSNNLIGQIPDEITEVLELVALNLSRNALQGKVPQLIGRLKTLTSLDLSRNMLSGKIPSSLSDLNFLSHLDVSYNNFSGKIPSGTQLQSFDASDYIGNVGLCGPPLTSKCPEEETPTLVVENEDIKEDNDEYVKWLYIGMAVGFGTGFWGTCGALLLNRRGRHAFFLFVDDLKDWFYVKIVVKLA